MSSIKHALLSLLAREPLSGYDMKQHMNGRVSFFYKINNNQLYPTLAKLEAEGLVRLEAHERESYRPARKVYSITDQGLDVLKAWVMDAEEPRSVDDFMLKQYNSWLVEPEAMIGILREKRKEHEERLEIYRGKITGFREQQAVYPGSHPLFSSIAVIEMGIRNEVSSIEWCDKVIEALGRDKI
ncbi:DNA-binding transcriptional regulator, PadR family [Paenibacillus sophorae]|uniref:DNA-binding transcriptional regulator, PadR family n=1 Tax=Paenibacillus sophorae TaxID=1333845 RepID=A0A1H8T5H7_9BACL|nr:PadR family transcriptional regulator [Paenibacillus sophorae]QWU17089.1 PadR family transcriptional regulator [Paenibacillus sophorae]SEO85773.1 DNA-binding transcriptional regulator, PadR family [Paenibacillus sophorae]